MDRRTFLAGSALGALILPAPAMAATASREFRILRGDSDIGRHRLDARQTAEGFEVRIDIDIAVKLLGITAYRYEMENTELWSDGRIVRVTSRVNDDGDSHFATIAANGNGLMVDGSEYSGPVSADAATTSYYAPAFLNRSPWISTQSGRPLDVRASQTGAGRWRVGGDIQKTLIYDAAGEWVGSEFDAKGELARYEVIGGSGAIAALWSAG